MKNLEKTSSSENLDLFYYRLLHLNQPKDSMHILQEQVERMREYMHINHIETTGMCKAMSNLVYNNLNDMGISCSLLNTYDLFNCYEHEFVVANLMVESGIEYILIDITYSQFLPKEKEKLSEYFKFFPTELLKGNHMLNDLLEKGYSLIDEEDFQLYLYSIHQNKEQMHQICLQDILYKTYSQHNKKS